MYDADLSTVDVGRFFPLDDWHNAHDAAAAEIHLSNDLAMNAVKLKNVKHELQSVRDVWVCAKCRRLYMQERALENVWQIYEPSIRLDATEEGFPRSE
jgi:hypothetical protein